MKSHTQHGENNNKTHAHKPQNKHTQKRTQKTTQTNEQHFEETQIHIHKNIEARQSTHENKAKQHNRHWKSYKHINKT